jgi:hypothetical protein
MAMVWCLSLYATTSSESLSNRFLQQPVNFFGIVETQQGNIFDVENITINAKCKQIVMYEKPSISGPQITQGEIMLDSDPQETLLKILIDLDEITSLSVPNRNQLWIYRRKNSERMIKYIEVIVTVKNSTAVQSYLLAIEYEDQIAFHSILPDGKAEAMTLPIRGLKKLTIAGYCSQEKGAPSCVQKESVSMMHGKQPPYSTSKNMKKKMKKMENGSTK